MHGEINSTINVLPPFKRLCQTIGELPASYLETMSYYESLLWFTKYLQETVIPTINNNAEAVSELQILYVQLENYVNNYFDNLDVQEEINNKLDQMANDGELTNLIASYVDPFIDAQNEHIYTLDNFVTNKLNSQDSKIESIKSGAPLFVNSIDDMTDTTKNYVLKSDGYLYSYATDSWVKQFQYLANPEETNDNIDLVNNTIVNANSHYTMWLGVGQSFNETTGASVNNAKRIRTDAILKKNISELKLLSDDYQMSVLYYSESTASNFQNYYVDVYSEWSNQIILKDYTAYAIRFKRVDSADMTSEDSSAIRSNLKVLSYTDTLFKSANTPPNSTEIRNTLDSIYKNATWIESDKKTTLQMTERRYFNRYTGERDSGNAYMSTYLINFEDANRVVFSSDTYNMRIYYYNGFTSDSPGLEPYYLGYESYTDDADIMIYSKYYYLTFLRKDGASINQTNEKTAIKNTFTLYTFKNNISINSRVNFHVSVNKNVLGNNETDSEEEISVLGTLIMPTSYTKTGEKTPIICLCHGSGDTITTGTWCNANWLALANTFVNNGYAVFGCNRLPYVANTDDYGKTYSSPVALNVMHEAFNYIKNRYNVQDKMFVHGASMGGATAQSYALMYPNDVIAVSCFAPANTLYSLWRSGNALRSDASADVIAQCFGYDTRTEAKEDDYKKLVGYNTGLTIRRYNENNILIPYTVKDVEDSVETAYNGGYWFNQNEYRECNYPVPIKCWCGTSDGSVQNQFTDCLVNAIRNAGGIAYIRYITGANHPDMVYGENGVLEECILWYNRFK